MMIMMGGLHVMARRVLSATYADRVGALGWCVLTSRQLISSHCKVWEQQHVPLAVILEIIRIRISDSETHQATQMRQ